MRDKTSTMFTSIRQGDVDLRNTIDNVVIGNDVTTRIQYDSGSHSIHAPRWLNLPRRNRLRFHGLLASNVNDRGTRLLNRANHRRSPQIRSVNGIDCGHDTEHEASHGQPAERRWSVDGGNNKAVRARWVVQGGMPRVGTRPPHARDVGKVLPLMRVTARCTINRPLRAAISTTVRGAWNTLPRYPKHAQDANGRSSSEFLAILSGWGMFNDWLTPDFRRRRLCGSDSLGKFINWMADAARSRQ